MRICSVIQLTLFLSLGRGNLENFLRHKESFNGLWL